MPAAKTYVYIDESGETGKRSKYIIFASIETESARSLEKVIRKIWRAKPQFHARGELHANQTDDATKVRVLHTLNEQSLKLRFGVIDKSKQTEPLEHVYYKKLATFIDYHRNAIVFIVDKKDTDKKRTLLIEKLGLQDSFRTVSFDESHKVRQLQAVDFVAWAIGRFYETRDKSFMDLLTDVREMPLNAATKRKPSALTDHQR